MKGETLRVNGDLWTIVDVAPAGPLAEMVAALLEDEGFVAITRGHDVINDVFSHLGAATVGTTFVLVPERDAARALRLIEDTVTDYEGEELAALLEEMAAEGGGETSDAFDAYDESSDDEDF